MDSDLDWQYLPLCGAELIDATAAVRGKHFPLQLLKQRFELRATAHLIQGEGGYLLVVDEVDRFENPQLKQVEATEDIAAAAQRVFQGEIRSWQLDDYRHVDTVQGARAVTRLGLVKRDDLQHCSSALREAFSAGDLGL